ncbi:DUF72 domain-containing protein [Alcanivorax sp.]|uniref:DUF72 domain-containing protein n=1 Tax=Alcanivorax sp. TaxID=1872427 RepID=UPI000C1185E0|nr:DUF72 domain-containing protein [Alcanivorax sp.]PHR67501.1 MAG: hypothetical protein COA55_06390 [Alcanivorax sp.]
MSLPYFLGCPQWQHPAWNARLPVGGSPLERYSRVFNAVEGNTSFYATPSRNQCEQWRAQVPQGFRFLFKFPRQITHDDLLRGVEGQVRAFVERLDPLSDVLGPFLLQLPAAFGPQNLADLWRFVGALPPSLHCTVEVRHRDFFAKGDAERALNRGLLERSLARVCFDSRALFAASAEDPATREAQRKKPRLPVHVLPGEVAPVIRYVGHPDLLANRPFLAPWVERAACWIEAGKQPCVFIHMPDNGDALALAALWHEMLTERLPWLTPLPLGRQVSQPGLF